MELGDIQNAYLYLKVNNTEMLIINLNVIINAYNKSQSAD